MSFETAKNYLESYGMGDRIRRYEASSATVTLAAEAIGCQPKEIAKSLTFMTSDGPILIVCSGDAKISNGKYKAKFGQKATMLTREQVSELIGHEVGGVCPFGLKDGVKVYLDISLKRFETIYPACGDS